MWFLTSVSYESVADSGENKKRKEKYLIDAMSCTEAEARAIKHLEPYTAGDIDVTDIKNVSYDELFFGSGDYFFDAKIAYLSVDEKRGGEKETKAKMLIQANDFEEACEALREGMKGTMADWKCKSVTETTIIEVLVYDLSEESKKLE